ncbi:bifunctional indole-3-glycerol-phosphate synthase TrpC/phosphoribosylanthranilate isomerase TrpF [Succinimonas amylolytica]|uniref:bifunctional indole-3-glycerol-phosphate synthase TrpC/phosphoribosylanthranilate isomerase TrpF n=1 Tax=Succinimonas amylolytica TaxID=83769 RepID=UPI0023A79A94
MSDPKPLTPGSELCSELRENPAINAASVDGNVLATILNAKPAWIREMQNRFPEEEISRNLIKSERSFYEALSRGKTRFILECKKASPSRGLIRPDFDPVAIARVYENYAAAISVLADERYFQGKYEYIREVSRAVRLPVLCKDFIYAPYQVLLARYFGGDAILLMLSVLTDEAYLRLADLAHSLGMGILTEASGEEEIARAVRLGARVIGINNRNLRNLSVDLGRVAEMARLIPEDRIAISESGIRSHNEILRLRNHVKGFLIGSTLTASPDVELAVRRVILGENKVCGIMRPGDAINSWLAGFVWNGLIFAKKSPRAVTQEQAREIIIATRTAGGRQGFVGVFVNEDKAAVAELVRELGLAAVQLHGSEDPEYARELRAMLPRECGIWKAIPVGDSGFPENTVREWLNTADRVVLDTKSGTAFGGTGKSFDWNSISLADRSGITVAGGLTPDNIAAAVRESLASGYDFNSGLEEAPGIKSADGIFRAMSVLRDY